MRARFSSTLSCSVPTGHVPRVELDEPNPAFDEPPGQQAAGAELGRGLLVEAVGAPRSRLAHWRGRQPQCRALHPVGEPPGLNSGGEFGVFPTPLPVHLVEPADQVESPAYGRRRRTPRPAGGRGSELALSERWFPGSSREGTPPHKTGGPPFDPSPGVRQDDEGQEVLQFFGPQAIRRGRLSPGRGLPMGIEPMSIVVDGLRVIDAVSPARPDDGDVVDAADDLREEVGDINPALAVLPKGSLRGEQRVRLLPCSRWRPSPKLAGKGWPARRLKVGLGIEGLGVAGYAVHEQVDDPFGLGGKVRRPGSQGIHRGGGRGGWRHLSPEELAPGPATRKRPRPRSLPRLAEELATIGGPPERWGRGRSNSMRILGSSEE